MLNFQNVYEKRYLYRVPWPANRAFTCIAVVNYRIVRNTDCQQDVCPKRRRTCVDTRITYEVYFPYSPVAGGRFAGPCRCEFFLACIAVGRARCQIVRWSTLGGGIRYRGNHGRRDASSANCVGQPQFVRQYEGGIPPIAQNIEPRCIGPNGPNSACCLAHGWSGGRFCGGHCF